MSDEFETWRSLAPRMRCPVSGTAVEFVTADDHRLPPGCEAAFVSESGVIYPIIDGIARLTPPAAD